MTILVEWGATLNYETALGKTALIEASIAGQVLGAEALLLAGAQF